LTKAGNGNEDLSTHLKDLKMPILVISGDDDQIIPTELSQRLAGDIPGAKLSILSSCGHVPHEECPGPFLKAVNEFISRTAIRTVTHNDPGVRPGRTGALQSSRRLDVGYP